MALASTSQMTSVVGQFQHKETGKYFEFRKTVNTTVPGFEHYPYEVFVGPQAESVRFARILKTVAYIAVDEDENGNPVEEKWPIKMVFRRDI